MTKMVGLWILLVFLNGTGAPAYGPFIFVNGTDCKTAQTAIAGVIKSGTVVCAEVQSASEK